MAAARMYMMIAAVLVAAALTVTGVSAQTHHAVGGWGPSLDINSWLSGRVFRVGDKILFKNSGTEEESVNVVELQGPEEFASCNLDNPIKMYTNKDTHVALDKEGVRYFASADPQSCKNGLKLPVPVYPPTQYDFPSPPYAYLTPPAAYPPPRPHPRPSPAAPLNPSLVSFAGILALAATLCLMVN